MVQMYMGQYQLVDCIGGYFCVCQCFEYGWYGQFGIVVDECSVFVFDYQIGGVEVVVLECGIDGVDVGVGGYWFIFGGKLVYYVMFSLG